MCQTGASSFSPYNKVLQQIGVLKLQSNVSKWLLEGLIPRVVGKDNETLRVVLRNKAMASPALFSTQCSPWGKSSWFLFGWDARGV